MGMEDTGYWLGSGGTWPCSLAGRTQRVGHEPPRSPGWTSWRKWGQQSMKAGVGPLVHPAGPLTSCSSSQPLSLPKTTRNTDSLLLKQFITAPCTVLQHAGTPTLYYRGECTP